MIPAVDYRQVGRCQSLTDTPCRDAVHQTASLPDGTHCPFFERFGSRSDRSFVQHILTLQYPIKYIFGPILPESDAILPVRI